MFEPDDFEATLLDEFLHQEVVRSRHVVLEGRLVSIDLVQVEQNFVLRVLVDFEADTARLLFSLTGIVLDKFEELGESGLRHL